MYGCMCVCVCMYLFVCMWQKCVRLRVFQFQGAYRMKNDFPMWFIMVHVYDMCVYASVCVANGYTYGLFSKAMYVKCDMMGEKKGFSNLSVLYGIWCYGIRGPQKV